MYRRIAVTALIVVSALGLAGCSSSPEGTARDIAQKVLSTGGDGLCQGVDRGTAIQGAELGEVSGSGDNYTVSFTSPGFTGRVAVDVKRGCATSAWASMK